MTSEMLSAPASPSSSSATARHISVRVMLLRSEGIISLPYQLEVRCGVVSRGQGRKDPDF